MRKFLLAAAATLAIQTPVHALIGIGVSGGLNNTSIDAKTESVTGADLPSYFGTANAPRLDLQREKMSGMYQLGVKAWLELPLLPIEFEAASNLAWGNYRSSLTYSDGINGTKQIPVDVPSPLVGFGEDKGSTPYVNLLTDLTIRYPLIEIPPVLHTLKLYVGAGVTHVLATRVIDKKDIQETFESVASGVKFDPSNQAGLESASKVVEDELMQSTIGGHVSVGAQLKVPVLPFAFFVDGKWYFNTATSDAATKYPLVVSGGVGFAL
ncbi:MAG: hypothetical protein RL173_1065 [Fibrobacterota bacterium]|jgi:hypothetical protein